MEDNIDDNVFPNLSLLIVVIEVALSKTNFGRSITISFLHYFVHTFPCLRIFVAETFVIRDTFRETASRLGGGPPSGRTKLPFGLGPPVWVSFGLGDFRLGWFPRLG